MVITTDVSKIEKFVFLHYAFLLAVSGARKKDVRGFRALPRGYFS